VVARIGGGAEDAERAIAITRWLTAQEFPVTRPLDVEQPVVVSGRAVTFWEHYPQRPDQRPGAAELGVVVRGLHDLPDPPLALPSYRPLSGLGRALEDCRLEAGTADWLARRRRDLLAAYERLEFVLPAGLIHGDAYPGNLLYTGHGVVLGDWDECAVGPREADLVNTYQGVRFGRTPEELRAFGQAYGYDVTEWDGFATMREMRDLHTLGSFIRRADRGDRAAAAELARRVGTLRRGSDERWCVG
jgi:aminoglycoside phosphotransferase (APT) family kinase protein